MRAKRAREELEPIGSRFLETARIAVGAALLFALLCCARCRNSSQASAAKKGQPSQAVRVEAEACFDETAVDEECARPRAHSNARTSKRPSRAYSSRGGGAAQESAAEHGALTPRWRFPKEKKSPLTFLSSPQ